MSRIDIRQLVDESLPSGDFPVTARSDFRLHFPPVAHDRIWKHAREDTSVEICGILVGHWRQDADGPFAEVVDLIRCDSAASKNAEVTFTHESWAHINHEMDTNFAEERIIGWYHTHPDFGVFLSDRDCFIHEHFFSNPGQVAFVVDPIRETEGVFAWRNGKPTLVPHFWIGDEIRTSAAAERSPYEKQSAQAGAVAARISQTGERSTLDLTTTLLSWMCLFLLGYILASQSSKWQHDMLIRGAVAQYGDNKLAKKGLGENLDELNKALALLQRAVVELPAAGAEITAEEKTAADKKRNAIAKDLGTCREVISHISQKYEFSELEWQTIEELRTPAEAGKEDKPESTAAPPADKPSSKVKRPTAVPPDGTTDEGTPPTELPATSPSAGESPADQPTTEEPSRVEPASPEPANQEPTSQE